MHRCGVGLKNITSDVKSWNMTIEGEGDREGGRERMRENFLC